MKLSFACHVRCCRSSLLPVLLLLIALCPVFSASGQSAPSLQGTSVPDTAVPVVITPAPQGSGFFVLNQDFSLLQHSTVDTSQNQSCTAPAIFSKANPAQRTLVTDLYNAYISGPDTAGKSAAVTALMPEQLCAMTTPYDSVGGLASQSLAANDIQHASYYLVSAYGSTQPDTLTILNNLNQATVSSSNMFSQQAQVSLDTSGQYTSVVADTRSDFGLTAVTGLNNGISPGNLWIYSPQTKSVYKILGPGGIALPAITSFLIPSQTDGGGGLLVLVNQDGLSSSGSSSPPPVTSPFTIIDLGQLQTAIAANPSSTTVTLPFVTQINATTIYYALLGAAYNPLDQRVYALAAGGTSAADYFVKVFSYDTSNPAAPGEKVVADISSIPFAPETFPQLALNAASGTMQILTASPAGVYSVGIEGTGNTPVAVTGATFPDSSFQPTYVAANPLQGETYIASASGQVDILTRPVTDQGGLTLTLTGSDLGYTSQQYELKPLALWPVYDSSLASTKLTITATPDGGNPVVIVTDNVADVGYPGSSFFTYTFPAPGRYTIQATAAASKLYPAVTSPPIFVYVGGTGVYPTAITLSVPATTTAKGNVANFDASVTLTGTTYAPSGEVFLTDQNGVGVADITLPAGVIQNPLTIPVTLGVGTSILTATYTGDPQNKGSQSGSMTVTVGASTKVSPVLHLSIPTTSVASGATVSGTLKTTSSSTTAPTGTVTIYATPPNSTTSVAVATVQAGQSFTGGGASFSFTAGTGGTYAVFAGYGGDSNYNNAVSGTVSLVVTSPIINTATGIIAPATAAPGAPFSVSISLTPDHAGSTPPTGNIVVSASAPNLPTTTVATVTAAQATQPGGYATNVTLANAGTYTLTASYAGDANYAKSGNTADVTVTSSLISTATGLIAPSSATVGTAFNVSVFLTPDHAGSTAPTGNIVVSASAPGIPSTTVATVTAAQATQPGGYAARITLAQYGSYTLTASYAGDANYAASGNTASLTVNGLKTSLSVVVYQGSDPGPTPMTTIPGQTFTLIVKLAPASGTLLPTGTITITSTSPAGASTTLTSFSAAEALDPDGSDTNVSVLTLGTDTLTASYSGDKVYSGSKGVTSIVAVQAQPFVNLSGPTTGIAPGPALLFNVLLGDGDSLLTGNITVTATAPGVPAISGTVSAAATTTTHGDGLNVPLTFTTPGVYKVSATYAGDAYDAAASAPSITVTVVSAGAANFSFTLTDPSAANLGDSPIDKTAILKATNGFNTPVAFTFMDPSSRDLHYVIHDHATGKTITSVTPTATGVEIDILVDKTDANLSQNSNPFSNRNIGLAALLSAVGLFSLRRRGRKFIKLLLCFCLMTVSAMVLSGCSGTDTVTITATPVNSTQGAPAQTVTFKVTYPD